MSPNTDPVIVGISGGVDSAVAAMLLQDRGLPVQGLFMKNWEEDDRDGHCAAEEDLAAAQAVCDRLAIELHSVNFSSEYWDEVFADFLSEYRAGRTPNPDVLCNSSIKFGHFLRHALMLGAGRIATGHYAHVVEEEGLYHLCRARDRNKDQTYFLHRLDQQQLRHACFPLHDLGKDAVRALARQRGLPNHERKDSTGICFIGQQPFREFLNRYLPTTPGDIVDPDGQVVGQHQGAWYYTPGQREGLGIGGRRGGSGAPWYVVERDTMQNRLVVAQGHDHPLLFHNALTTGAFHWISGSPGGFPFDAVAQVRHRQAAQDCVVHAADDGAVRIEFRQPQRALTTGQSAVLYCGDRCLGGGVINEIHRS